jgi:hypothetical protein
MARLNEITQSVVDQLERYGQVLDVDSRSGTFMGPNETFWSWTIFGDMVTFERDAWRTRRVTVDKVSEYMFAWLYELGALEFSVDVKTLVKAFGTDGAHQAFLAKEV